MKVMKVDREGEGGRGLKYGYLNSHTYSGFREWREDNLTGYG